MENLSYRGYGAEVRYSEQDNCYYGRVTGTGDFVDFIAETENDIEKEFRAAVDGYRIVWYREAVYREMERRGYDRVEIPRIIAKTGFEATLEKYPDLQLQEDISDAVDEIISTAAGSEGTSV